MEVIGKIILITLAAFGIFVLLFNVAFEIWVRRKLKEMDNFDLDEPKDFLKAAEMCFGPVEEKFEGATEQLTDAQKRYIEAIVAAGYTTEKEYVKALQEGTAALENMEPDTWIQGLINLQEASIEAAEKVNDLKDELADLEEQLIEDKEAVDEAAQALHEAKFGTEDFQSGLDGLINYERPL